ncbi:MAG TPA: tripartite tricarboxylate transporter permease [Candidatus Eisenbacteria bacterium]|nr:tripartite tricarboxylate transporter permease [Candidatus Eisenbacteria bacterium]
MVEIISQSLASILEPRIFFSMVAGALAGLIGGAIPGVTITMTVILVLPFTFGMDPLQGIATMIGVYIGGESGGLVSASLIGIPGTPSAIATTFDGHPMAKKGEPGRAVWTGIWASLLGGLLAGIALVVGATQLARLALSFGPWEYFSLFVLTLSVVGALTEGSIIKGLLSGTLGLLVTTIGTDPLMSIPRFTFGLEFLHTGFAFLPILIGLFAFSQLMQDLETRGTRVETQSSADFDLSVSHLQVLKDILSQPFNLIWSTLVGLWIGILPAVGGSAANILAYDQAKKFSKHPEKFGTGISDGIIASEASNNANVGGSLITMMAFGIPGDAVTAVMLGALIIHGIQPGPLFVITNVKVAYGMLAAYFIAHLVTVVIEAGCLRFFIKVVTVPLHTLVPIVLVFCVVGSYALNNIMENVYTLLIFGVLGYFMVKTGFPLAPMVLGVILGDQIEVNLIRSIMTDSNLWLFLTRPISGTLLVLAFASFVLAIYQEQRSRKPGRASA